MDTTLTGTIKKIETKRTNSNGVVYTKKLVHISDREAIAFVEFRSDKMASAIKNFKEGDLVEIDGYLNGNISKSSGQHYNNIIAKRIVKCEDSEITT